MKLIMKPFFFKKLTRLVFLIVCGLILSQCAEKTSKQYVEEGMKFTRNEEYGRALESFLHAIDKDKSNPQAYYGLGGIYNVQQSYAQAVAVFQTAVQLDPTFMDAYYSLGYSFEMLGNKDEAKINYDRYHALKGKFDKYMEKERNKN
jgi:Tfp pilus assembly protein PilF